jgi:hypothetical protein
MSAPYPNFHGLLLPFVIPYHPLPNAADPVTVTSKLAGQGALHGSLAQGL